MSKRCRKLNNDLYDNRIQPHRKSKLTKKIKEAGKEDYSKAYKDEKGVIRFKK